MKKKIAICWKIIRIPCKCVTARLISTFQSNKISLSKENTTIRHFFINDIKTIISNVDPTDSFYSWTDIFFYELRWMNLVEKLELNQNHWNHLNLKDPAGSDNSDKDRYPPDPPPLPLSVIVWLFISFEGIFHLIVLIIRVIS